jgi:hypothetical protein
MEFSHPAFPFVYHPATPMQFCVYSGLLLFNLPSKKAANIPFIKMRRTDILCLPVEPSYIVKILLEINK